LSFGHNRNGVTSDLGVGEIKSTMQLCSLVLWNLSQTLPDARLFVHAFEAMISFAIKDTPPRSRGEAQDGEVSWTHHPRDQFLIPTDVQAVSLGETEPAEFFNNVDWYAFSENMLAGMQAEVNQFACGDFDWTSWSFPDQQGLADDQYTVDNWNSIMQVPDLPVLAPTHSNVSTS
jgi:hypothetical protein